MEKIIIIDSVQKYKRILDEKFLGDFEIERVEINKEFFTGLGKGTTLEDSYSKTIEKKLKSFSKKPVLYWFTFKNEYNGQENLRKDFENFCSTVKVLEFRQGKKHYQTEQLEYRRALSSYKTLSKEKSNVLYVGKVKKNFWGRLATHAGWATSPKTAGLQLRYWYDFDKYPVLQLNYITLDTSLSDFVSILELELAKKLKPLIGRY